MFDITFEFKVSHPIGFHWFHQSKAIALKEVDRIVEWTPRKRTLATFGLKMTIPAPVHAFIRCHSQHNNLIRLTLRQH